MSTDARTDEQILARIAEVAEDDLLGFSRDVLTDWLGFEAARPYLKPEVTEATWAECQATLGPIEQAALGYLEFAIGKIEDHRGISASRSVAKLTEFAWLMGRDDVVAAMDAAGYENYGAPKVRAFAEGMGFDWPDSPTLSRMAQGLPCEPGCDGGCGR